MQANPGLVLGEPVDLPAEADIDARRLARALEQKPLDIHLVDVKHRLRELVGHRHLPAHGDALVAARHGKAVDFVRAQPREIGLIERMVAGSPSRRTSSEKPRRR